KKLFVEKRISEQAEEIMKARETIVSNTPNENPVIDNAEFESQVMAPIHAGDEPAGVVVLMSKEP
ncbi:MAG TPA: stage V sporulation protein T, partial [Firmicutes bacterium]|nr:stage V sporulation protein T [Bacillota bacterium]